MRNKAKSTQNAEPNMYELVTYHIKYSKIDPAIREMMERNDMTIYQAILYPLQAELGGNWSQRTPQEKAFLTVAPACQFMSWHQSIKNRTGDIEIDYLNFSYEYYESGKRVLPEGVSLTWWKNGEMEFAINAAFYTISQKDEDWSKISPDTPCHWANASYYLEHFGEVPHDYIVRIGNPDNPLDNVFYLIDVREGKYLEGSWDRPD